MIPVRGFPVELFTGLHLTTEAPALITRPPSTKHCLTAAQKDQHPPDTLLHSLPFPLSRLMPVPAEEEASHFSTAKPPTAAVGGPRAGLYLSLQQNHVAIIALGALNVLVLPDTLITLVTCERGMQGTGPPASRPRWCTRRDSCAWRCSQRRTRRCSRRGRRAWGGRRRSWWQGWRG